jgi:energy-coupling factor transport system ATP-binding protein
MSVKWQTDQSGMDSGDPAAPALAVTDYSFSYIRNDGSKKEALRGLSFEIEKGTVTAVIGLSGCGKTTLCKSLCGIIPHCCDGIRSGTILVHGEDTQAIPLNRLARRIGFVMQNPDDQLVTTTVEDEFAFALENLAAPPAEIRKKVDEMSSLLGLSGLRTTDPNRLSGGQKQLAAIGSVLILQPDILVLDEPTSHLDKEGKERILEVLHSLKTDGKTIVVVGHDPGELTFADRWLILSDGGIYAYGTPEKIADDARYAPAGAMAEILGTDI